MQLAENAAGFIGGGRSAARCATTSVRT